MATTTARYVHCDLCGYGGRYIKQDVFKKFAGDIDLCRWCADDRTLRAVETGRHLITFGTSPTDGTATWSCSCGEEFRRPVLIRPAVLAVVPNIALATAYIHSEAA